MKNAVFSLVGAVQGGSGILPTSHKAPIHFLDQYYFWRIFLCVSKPRLISFFFIFSFQSINVDTLYSILLWIVYTSTSILIVIEYSN